MSEIDLHPRIGPERLQDDVPSLAVVSLFLGQLARIHQSLHQRLVFGELDDLPTPSQIGPAVPDLGQPQSVTQYTGNGRGRAHSPELRVLARVLVDPMVRELHRL